MRFFRIFSTTYETLSPSESEETSIETTPTAAAAATVAEGVAATAAFATTGVCVTGGTSAFVTGACSSTFSGVILRLALGWASGTSSRWTDGVVRSTASDFDTVTPAGLGWTPAAAAAEDDADADADGLLADALRNMSMIVVFGLPELASPGAPPATGCDSPPGGDLRFFWFDDDCEEGVDDVGFWSGVARDGEAGEEEEGEGATTAAGVSEATFAGEAGATAATEVGTAVAAAADGGGAVVSAMVTDGSSITIG